MKTGHLKIGDKFEMQGCVFKICEPINKCKGCCFDAEDCLFKESECSTSGRYESDCKQIIYKFVKFTKEF